MTGRALMRAALLAGLIGALSSGCPETRRCPDAQVFDEEGRCVGVPDAAAATDGG